MKDLRCGAVFTTSFSFITSTSSYNRVRPCDINRVAEDGEMLLVGFLPDIDRVADCFDGEVLLDNDRVESEL